ncbi:hypothetical protein J437_LFUL000489 [Ladona fulva]|uniref:Uncharacterized protein n=1 Tax=Ladona fulva TaxID=123851 RepID=A0A8K0JUB7_LADFU|nr:hypothetical protein J437_LFUL000489 [Ladona fulva]
MHFVVSGLPHFKDIRLESYYPRDIMDWFQVARRLDAKSYHGASCPSSNIRRKEGQCALNMSETTTTTEVLEQRSTTNLFSPKSLQRWSFSNLQGFLPFLPKAFEERNAWWNEVAN